MLQNVRGRKSSMVKTIFLALALAFSLSGCSAGSQAESTPRPSSSAIACLTAYDLWLTNGHEGSEQDFLDSLVGEKGADGYVGSDGLSGADGIPGKSAYQIWLDLGNKGTKEQFLASLTGNSGTDGVRGLSAYDLWIELGNTGTVEQFLQSLVGPAGSAGVCTVGAAGEQGPAGPAGATGATGAVLSPVEQTYVVGGGTTGTGSVPPSFNGAPLFSGSYLQVGKVVYFNVSVVMTNITDFGRGQYFITLPFNSKYAFSTSAGRITDESSGHDFNLHGYVSAGSNIMLLTYDSGAQQVAFDHNSPITLTVRDVFIISGNYFTN